MARTWPGSPRAPSGAGNPTCPPCAGCQSVTAGATSPSHGRLAPGARPVLNAFTEEVARRELVNVTVTQTGCIGICQYEPVVEVFAPGKEKVTYVKMTAEKVARVVGEHLVGGNPVDEYTIGAFQK